MTRSAPGRRLRLRLPSRLSGKLLAAIVPPIVLAIGAIVAVQYVAARREILSAVDKEMRLVAQRTAAELDDLLAQRRRDLLTLAESTLITDYDRNVEFQLTDEAAAYRRELQRYLERFAGRAQGYAAIAYVDARGREVCRVGPSPAPPAALLDSARGAGAADPAPSLARLKDGRAVLLEVKAIRGDEGELRGALALAYDLAQARALLASIQVGRRGRAFVQAGPALRLEGRPASGAADLLRASRTLQTLPWTLVVEAPPEDFLGPLQSVRDAALATSLAGLAALVLVLLLLVRSVTGPVAALAGAARAIGAGDLSRRVPPGGEDEIGALANAFNEMAHGLDASRKATTQLQAQLIQAEKLSAVGQLISAVAHELNNPLAAISGYAQIALREELPPELQDDLRHVYANVLRCRKVVDNLLFFVRQSRHERKPIALERAVASALELLEYRLVKTEDVRVRQELAPGLPEVLGDFQQIVQVLVNLIGNACDAMDAAPGEGGKVLVLRTGARDGDAFIEVEDNGPGIPLDAQARVFEPFFTTKEPGRGTGLGLSICRQIAQEHGGDISFESRPGGGTTFRVELPVASPADLAGRAEEDAPPRWKPAPGKRVLVADDEEDIAALIARLLREDGDEAVVARDGAEALAALERGAFDLVVSDIGMERVKGYELYEALGRAGRRPRMLFVTGDILNPKVLEFFARTGVEHLVKPFDVEELRHTLRRLLGAERA